MSKTILCSVLVTTYNRPRALELCLLSLFEQTETCFEIIVCDDGSGPATQQLITRLQTGSPVPIRHVWQPDEGFQLARIRNKGIAAAQGSYIIQIDGDVIAHRDFVRDHLRNARRGCFLSGNQIKLEPMDTGKLLMEPPTTLQSVLKNGYPAWRQWRSPLLQALTRRFYHWKKEYEYVLGCNMSFWRDDLIAANGYDEAFTGWGWEDTELALRLMNHERKLQFIRFGGILYHLHHPIAARTNEDANRERALLTKTQKRLYCPLGVDQHLSVTP